MKKLGKYSMGIGDRFGHQGKPQIAAIIEAGKKGVEITPVWNKSNREHQIIGTAPEDVRKEADAAIREAGFRKPYFVDADHINFDTVDRFLNASDFFTIDVAAFIGQKSGDAEMKSFLERAGKYKGKLPVPGIPRPFTITKEYLKGLAEKYLFATAMAGVIYRKIEASKGRGKFVTEVSMDEVPLPQKPAEFFFILLMLSIQDVPVQTIAPKFSGRFNKGVDYQGDPALFALEFETDLLVIARAVEEFNLPGELKISVHSGSDKFSVYPHIGRIIRKHNRGIHLKTAGTTWLEEITGLALAGGDALKFVKEIYEEALGRADDLCAPYADVIDIKSNVLPSAAEVSKWDSRKLTAALRHDSGNSDYNPGMRQLIHVAYKLAAARIEEYSYLLEKHSDIISACVFDNIYNRHICRLFDIR